MESILGWKLLNPERSEIEKTLKQGESHSIAQLRSGERFYRLEFFPQISGQEEELIKSIFEEFLENKRQEKTKTGIEESLLRYCERNLIDLEEDQKDYLLRILFLMVFEFGPISCFLHNNLVEEVSIIGVGKDKPVFVYEKNFGWLKSNLFFDDEETVKNLANRMGRKIGRHLSLQKPLLNAFLPDGSRLNACIDPVALEPALTIRKFRDTPFTPTELVQNNTLSFEAVAFLWFAMQSDVSVLVCGNTGSGKTTTLNALFCFVPKEERIVVTEETPEINLVQKHVVTLKTVENIGVKMTDLIVNTFRMRPDRIIVGEIRDSEEVNAFINTLLAGQAKGSFATFHAKTSREAVLRLKKLGVMEMDLDSIDLIVTQKRWTKIGIKKNVKREVRMVTEITEVVNENGEIKLNNLFELDLKKNVLLKKCDSFKVMQKICSTFGLTEKQVQVHLKKRVSFLKKIVNQNLSLEEFFRVVNSEGI